jgi:hypothetical protein
LYRVSQGVCPPGWSGGTGEPPAAKAVPAMNPGMPGTGFVAEHATLSSPPVLIGGDTVLLGMTIGEDNITSVVICLPEERAGAMAMPP